MSRSTAEPHRAHRAAAAVEPKPRRSNFLREFLRTPALVGAIAPSGRALCRTMVKMVDMERVKVAVEYGPGTGPCTAEIIPALRPGTRFFAVEINPRLAAIVASKHPGLKVHVRSAADMSDICVEEGLAPESSVDAIFSCIPWASFPKALQDDVMAATLRVLKPGGVMVTFAYHVGLLTPSGRRFKKMLRANFHTIDKSRAVLNNLPTAFVYRCVK